MKIGDHVQHTNDKWFGGLWTGEIKEISDCETRARVKWDPDFTLPENHPEYYITFGLWHSTSVLKVVDPSTKLGKRDK